MGYDPSFFLLIPWRIFFPLRRRTCRGETDSSWAVKSPFLETCRILRGYFVASKLRRLRSLPSNQLLGVRCDPRVLIGVSVLFSSPGVLRPPSFFSGSSHLCDIHYRETLFSALPSASPPFPLDCKLIFGCNSSTFPVLSVPPEEEPFPHSFP